jgi:LacI family transcriptional regulator
MKRRISSTIRDVARRAGVSIATVSRYINKTVPVSSEVGEKIQKSMIALDFVPNTAARNLAKKKYHTIGLLISDIKGDFFSAMVREIEKESREAGFDLLISIVRGKQKNDQMFSFPIGPQNTDGAIVFVDCINDRDLKFLYENQFPVVLVSRSSPAGMQIPCIDVENMRSTCGIIEHLITVHHKTRIVFLRGLENHEDSHQRETAFRQTLQKHGIQFDPDLVGQGNFDRDVSYASMKAMIQKDVKFDAVFGSDDDCAIGALAALAEAGFKVPDQISVVGFDDQEISTYLNPPLTTVHASFKEVGCLAVQQLIKLINKESVEPSIVVPSELIIRHSCGC